MKTLASLLALILTTFFSPAASGFDAKPGRYKGTLKLTTSFPDTDVKQAVIQRATARLDANGRMIIALSNTFDGIEEAGQHAAFVKFVSPTDNNCLVRILKDNFILAGSSVTVKGKVIRMVRTQALASQDAEGFNANYNVEMELKLTRVAP